MCDVCKKSIYRGDSPSDAHADFVTPPPDAPRGSKTKFKPMRATPPPNVDHARVTMTGSMQTLLFEKQACGRECARVAALEAVDIALAESIRNEAEYARHSITIVFNPKQSS
jgi:hypothetical protein